MTDLASKIRARAEDWVENCLNPQAAAEALIAVLDIHKPDPEFTPPEGVCRSCGGTGEVYGGTGADGHIWTGEKCCCDHPHCLGCGECWVGDGCPAHRELIKTVSKALGIEVTDDEG